MGVRPTPGHQPLSGPGSTLSGDPSQSLVEAAREGNPQALSHVLADARRWALRQALARTQDPDDSEDIAQEVLLSVVTHLHRFRFESRFSSWVYRITENQILGQSRKRGRREAAERTAWVPDPADRLLGEIDGERMWARVREAAGLLPDLQREAFRRVVMEGLAPREAARILGKSATNLRASLSWARARVAARLVERSPGLAGD